MATYTSNYGWTKPSGSDNVDISVLNDNLDDQDSTIHDAFLNMAVPFSESSTYAVDAIVLYGTGLYKCHTAVVTPGSWTGSTNWQVYKLSEGGGGTTDYDDLINHPSINNVELSGNKTGTQLGLQNTLTFDNIPTANSNNPVKSGGVYAVDEAIRKWTTAEAKSVSGNPITLTDGSARNAEALSVTCNPKQNLHGYDHPWAGGAGKNKLPLVLADIKSANTSGTWSGNDYSYNGVTYTINTDSDGNIISIKANGTASQWANLNLALSLEIASGNYIINGIAGGSFDTYLMQVVPSGGGANIALAYASDTSFTISSAMNIRVAIIVKQDVTVTNQMFYPMIRLASVSDATFEPYTNECPITGYTECVVTVKDEEEATQDTATITFGQTVYGGSVDFKTGVGIVDKAFATFDGSDDENWDVSSDRFRCWSLPNKAIDNTTTVNGVSNEYNVYSAGELYGNRQTANWIGCAVSKMEFLIVDNVKFANKDLSEFKTWLASNPVQVCYKLATPIILQLSPAELELLKGYNYITTNGTTISLNYLPDSLLAEAENYVDAKIPPAPSSDGTYVLTCTVTSGVPAYTWESTT